MAFSIGAIIGKFVYIIIWTGIAVGMGIAAWWYIRIRKFTDNVIILRRADFKDPNSPIIRGSDKGGIWKIKSGAKEYRLKRTKTSLSLENYKFMLNEKKGRTVILWQYEDGYRFVGFKLDDSNIDISLTNEDITGAIRDYDKFSNAFAPASWFERYGGMLSLIVVAFALIVVIAVVLNKFEVLQGVANALKEAAQALAQAKSAAVTPAVPPPP